MVENPETTALTVAITTNAISQTGYKTAKNALVLSPGIF